MEKNVYRHPDYLMYNNSFKVLYNCNFPNNKVLANKETRELQAAPNVFYRILFMNGCDESTIDHAFRVAKQESNKQLDFDIALTNSLLNKEIETIRKYLNEL